MVIFTSESIIKQKDIASDFSASYNENKAALREIIEQIHEEKEVTNIQQDVIKSSALILPNLLNPNLINSYLNNFISECRAPCNYLISSSQQSIKNLVLEMIQVSFKRFPELSHLLKTKIYNYINQ